MANKKKVQQLKNLTNPSELSKLTMEQAVCKALKILLGNKDDLWLTGGTTHEGDTVYFTYTPDLYLPGSGPARSLVGKPSAIMLIDGHKFIFHGDKGYKFTGLVQHQEISREEMEAAFINWVQWVEANQDWVIF